MKFRKQFTLKSRKIQIKPVFPLYESLRRLFQIEESKQWENLLVEERGQNVSTKSAMNASDTYVAPLFILPRKNTKKPISGSLPESIGIASDSGWTR